MRFPFISNLKTRVALTVSILILLTTVLAATMTLVLVGPHITALPTGELSGLALATLVAALLLAGLFGTLAWRTIHHQIAPLQLLLQRMQRDSTGAAAQSQGGDEIGNLSRAFDVLLQERMSADHRYQSSQARLRLIADNIPALVAYVDAGEQVVFANRRYEQAYGVAPEHLGKLNVKALLGDDVYAQSAPYIAEALGGQATNFERLVTHGGQVRWERVSYVPERADDGSVAGFISLAEDITELKRAQHTFARSEMRLRMITDNMPALIAYIDTEQRYRFCNDYYETILHLPSDQVLGQTVRHVMGEAAYAEAAGYIELVLRGERVSFEQQTSGPAGRYFLHDYLPDLDAGGAVTGFYSMVQDITKLKQVENQLRILARFDNLTGLPNRNQFDEKLAAAMARSRRSKQVMALMFLDIDHFKSINDTLGHQGGDEVLREFGRRLLASVRKTDTVSRLAGDEFVIILEGLHLPEESATVAAKIIDAMATDFDILGIRRKVSTSIGIALGHDNENDGAALLRRADEALYEAKAAGRNMFRTAPGSHTVS
ncbi:diguanylate cyclase (GGDEF)-like protein/PAS domain S-box-containing protein [Actimicrobium sp. GrIS 1.19]|uniref:diguanylate cyclase domain-containing protein n=1 Tax=Actimicrobium sp. GrIS 1.19 TaxID=3071708 RepID=UPI002DFE29D1|nr:diguanylate cyclase (GGDEF)-like protein/PAS domain S-box-containing protein [Actimicrobium sp. GrIS 1.19]